RRRLSFFRTVRSGQCSWRKEAVRPGGGAAHPPDPTAQADLRRETALCLALEPPSPNFLAATSRRIVLRSDVEMGALFLDCRSRSPPASGRDSKTGTDRLAAVKGPLTTG